MTMTNQSCWAEITEPRATRVGQAFDMGGAPFGVSFFKGCGLSPYADSLLFALACTELLMAWRNSMLVLVWYPRP